MGQPTCDCGTSADVFVEDDFSLFGFPAGTPVALTAHLNTNSTEVGFHRSIRC